MTKRLVFIASTCILLMIFVSGCPQPHNPSPETTVPETAPRIFNARRIKAIGDDENIKVTAHLAKSTAQLEIYLQEGGTMTTADINYIADEFAKDYPTLTNIYGTHSDVDTNEKIIILLYDMNDNPSGPGGYVAGYFSPKDLFKPNPDELTALSNEAEILYVESEVSGEIEGIYDTVIHEFQHLINFNMNSLAELGQSDLWLNEALSESTAIVKSGGMPINRLAIYNDIKYPTSNFSFHDSIQTGNYFYYWNTDDYVLADYATASLFMYWLYLNGGEKNILQDIAQASSTVRGDYQAVLEAVGKTDATGPLNSLTAWEDVLFAWLEANENEAIGYPRGVFTGNAGSSPIKNNIRTKVYPSDGSQQIAMLFSGGAILAGSRFSGGGDLVATETFVSDGEWISSPNNPATIYITLNKSTEMNQTYLQIPLSSVAPVYNTVPNNRRSNFPVLLDDGYRIRPRSQTLLPEGDFE